MTTATQKIPSGYKQTEIGVIPADWDVNKLGKVCKYQNGTSLERYFNQHDGYKVISIGNYSTSGNYIDNGSYISFELRDRVSKFILNKDDLTMILNDKTSTGEIIGRVLLIEKSDGYVFNQRTMRLTSDSDVLPKYLYFLINSSTVHKKLARQAKPGTQIYFNTADILDFEISFPKDKVEQSTIINALSDADILIKKIEALIEKKKNIKQGVMQELLTGKRRLAGFSGKWDVKLLPEISWFQEGPGVRTSQFTPTGIKLLNGTNIYKGRLILDSTNRFISEREAFGPYSHFLVDDGDILIASSGITIDKFEEKISFAKKENLPLCMNTSTIRFKVKGESIDALFLYYFFMSKKFKDQIGAWATGSAQLNFGPSHLDKIEICLPKEKAEQTAITAILVDIDAEIEKLESQLTKYQNIKQGMMQTLLTGKIRLLTK